MRPIITRDGNGNIHKHWTMESAEAAEQERKAALAERIAAKRTPMRATIVQRVRGFFRSIYSRLTPRGSRLVHPERI